VSIADNGKPSQTDTYCHLLYGITHTLPGT